jgi:hypothetical protein
VKESYDTRTSLYVQGAVRRDASDSAIFRHPRTWGLHLDGANIVEKCEISQR